MIHSITDNPQKAAQWGLREHAEEAARKWAESHSEAVRPAVRVEPSDDSRGYSVRVFSQGGHPIMDRIGWLKEKRIVRSKRRKVEE